MFSDSVILTARISALSDRLLTIPDVERMVSATNFEDAFRVLNDISWSGAVADAPNINDFERVIDAGLFEIRHELQASGIPQNLEMFLFLPFDLQNAKCTVLSLSKGKSYDDFRELLSSLGYFEKSLSFHILSGDLKEIPKEALFLETALRESFSLLQNDSKKQEDALALLDIAFFRRLSEVLSRVRNRTITEFFQKQIDWENIKKILRGSSEHDLLLLIPQEKKGSKRMSFEESVKMLRLSPLASVLQEGLALKEKGGDIFLFEAKTELSLLETLFWPSRLSPLSYETVVLFFLTKLRNAEVIRTILVGKRNKKSIENIRNDIAHFLPFLPR